MLFDAIAIIPARLESTRLPRKPLLDLGGAPLVVRVCEAVARAGLFHRIVVACDHEDIASVVRSAGYEASLTPPELPSGTDRIAAVAKTLALSADTIVVNVQGDEPFVTPAALQSLLDAFRQNPSVEECIDGNTTSSMPGSLLALPSIVTVIERCTDLESLRDPNVVKVALGEYGRALYFSRAPIPFVRDFNDPVLTQSHFRHIGLYAFRASTLQAITGLPEHPLERIERLEQLRWLAHGHLITCVEVSAGARGIDTPEDLMRARTEFTLRDF